MKWFKVSVHGRFARRWASWHYKLWWLDVIYPFILSAFLFATLSYLIYHGEKHRSISAQIEEALINFSLRIASPRLVLNPHRIMTVTLKEYDLKKIEHHSFRDYEDATIAEYAKTLGYLLEQGVSYLIVNWMPNPDESTPAAYDELTAALAKARPDQKVIFAVHPHWKNYLPETLYKVAHILESDPCQISVQLICIYNPQWDDWVIQELSRDLWIEKKTATERNLVSTNLPRINPSFLLYLNKTRDFQDYSFAELQEIWFPDGFFDGKIVMIGNGLVQRRIGNPDQVGRVATVLSPRNQHPRMGGTPYHKFWAQLAQLFIDDDMVAIVPLGWSLALAVGLALLITLSLATQGVPTALGLFLCFATFAPLANALFIRFFHYYLPLFDSLYAATASFILVTFCKLSFESFQNWRLSIQERDDSEIADTKGNFISLISHNLNTPVAKMQGVLELLAQVPQPAATEADFKLAMALSTRIQLCIRFLLVATALDDGRLNHEAMNVHSVVRLVEDEVAAALRQLGIDLQLLADRSELSQMPLPFDRRVLTSAIASMAVLFFKEGQGEEACALGGSLRIAELSDAQGEALVCSLVSGRPWLSPEVAAHLTAEHRQPPRELIGASLLEDVAANLVVGVAHAYRGLIELFPASEGQGGELRLTLVGRSLA